MKFKTIQAHMLANTPEGPARDELLLAIRATEKCGVCFRIACCIGDEAAWDSAKVEDHHQSENCWARELWLEMDRELARRLNTDLSTIRKMTRGERP